MYFGGRKKKTATMMEKSLGDTDGINTTNYLCFTTEIEKSTTIPLSRSGCSVYLSESMLKLSSDFLKFFFFLNSVEIAITGFTEL